MPDRPEDDLQLDQADYVEGAKASAKACSACSGSLGAQYFIANNHVVCESCVEQLNAQRSMGSPISRVSLAVVLGLVAGALGAGLYFAIAKLTGYEFGLIAIVVGFAVGAAVRWGSGGRGGKPYQILAVFITYAAIVSTYIPAVVEGFNMSMAQEANLEKDPEKIAKVTVMRDQSVRLDHSAVSMEELDAELARVSSVGGQAWYHREGMADERPGAAADQVADVFVKHNLALLTFSDAEFRNRESWFDTAKRGSISQILVIAGALFSIAATVPFYSLPENIIGLLIIAFAIFQAWRSNKLATIDIRGPLQIAELRD